MELGLRGRRQRKTETILSYRETELGRWFPWRNRRGERKYLIEDRGADGSRLPLYGQWLGAF